MRVHVSYENEVSDDYRRALRYRYGKTGLATADELADHFRSNGTSMDDDLMYEWETRERLGRKRKKVKRCKPQKN